MTSRSFPWRASVVALTLGLAACGEAPASLRVGANIWPGYGPLFVAESLGHYHAPRVQIFSFPNATDVMRAYRSRAIDVAAVTADEALALAQTDPEQRIILVCDASNGADMILAKPPVATVADLRGRTVAMEAGALGAYMLARALQAGGVKDSEVTVHSRGADTMHTGYDDSRVDAVVAFDPVATQILQRGARKIFDSSQIPGEILDVLVTRRSVIERQPANVQQLVDGWFLAVGFLKDNPAEAGRRVASRGRLPPDTYPAALRTIEIFDAPRNARFFTTAAGALPAQLRSLHDVMIEHKLLSAPVPLAPLPDGRFVTQAARRQPAGRP
ncbi:MAG: ABC transporter substrate-binding protein [Verrucomicrobia bacterium]|nr:ABC transporter substrate-binding protein [Verrucomicrobiota bacterium]